MSRDAVLEELRREIDPAEYAAIRELWKTQVADVESKCLGHA